MAMTDGSKETVTFAVAMAVTIPVNARRLGAGQALVFAGV
jgi:hypothetical protein